MHKQELPIAAAPNQLALSEVELAVPAAAEINRGAASRHRQPG